MSDAPNTGQADALREALVGYATHYGARCRDCADENGVCPSTGIGCGERNKAAGFIVDALIYGAAHGFCPAALPATTDTASDTAIPAGEAVAWLYEKNGKQSLQPKRQPWNTSPDRGWAETPLYAARPSQGESVERLVEAGDYLISLYERLWKGGVVRDLAEAIGAWHNSKRALSTPAVTVEGGE